MQDNANKAVAFITGAASGIGAASAKAFCAAGYDVALIDSSEDAGRAIEQHLISLGNTCRFIACDVAQDVSVQRAVEETIAIFGRLDAAFNAAGIDGEMGKPTAECSLNNWDKVIAVDLSGIFFCMRHQIPAMLRCGAGAIVNCASTAGIVGAPQYSAYSAAKHGVIGLTKSAALEYARAGIRVNAVCPGMIDTPMTRGGTKEALFDTYVASSPMARRGRPEEIADAAVWLCSKQASFITGQAIPVDGALTSC